MIIIPNTKMHLHDPSQFRCCFTQCGALGLLSARSSVSFWLFFIDDYENLTGGGRVLCDGSYLVSANRRFELGFFSPKESRDRYLGVWFKNLPLTVVWIANRRQPVRNKNGCLRFVEGIGLGLFSGKKRIWVVRFRVKNPTLELLGSGNLVVKNGSLNNGEYVWESFDHPCDTLLPGMKLGWDMRRGVYRKLSSWRAVNDPNLGEFEFGLDLPQSSQLVLWKDMVKVYRWGPWSGGRISGTNEWRNTNFFNSLVVSSGEEIYYSFTVPHDIAISRLVLSYLGTIGYLSWREDTKTWVDSLPLQRDICDKYALCGPYGSCHDSDPKCRCLKGFHPQNHTDWEGVDWSVGCVRDWKLNCQHGDEFVEYDGLKFPDNMNVLGDNVSDPDECRKVCLKNCSCMAYAAIDLRGNGSQCAVWYGVLTDLRYYPQAGGVLYVRMAAEEIRMSADAKAKKEREAILIACMAAASGTTLLVAAGRVVFWRRRKSKSKGEILGHFRDRSVDDSQMEELELQEFDLKTLSLATNGFAEENKIGKGGFGNVYRGVLSSGQEIAVKRLAEDSKQGAAEFKNEVMLTARLGHRNLVRLVGWYSKGSEHMLVYDYMPNRSLDHFVYEKNRAMILDWKTRFSIIMGIARGLLYLHQDSRLRIIHRDLKTSNILLDQDMNPLISDFGVAKVFEADERHDTNKKLCGTHGYMSPEYITRGHISLESDVYSFGIIMLEIISGRKVWSYNQLEDDEISLLGDTWTAWSELNPLKIVDKCIENSVDKTEVIRCIQVGLLCAQQYPEDRPTMSSVISMLSTSIDLPSPKLPGFVPGPSRVARDSDGHTTCTINDVTNTILEER